MNSPAVVTEIDSSQSGQLATLVEVLVDDVVVQTLDTVTTGSVTYDAGSASRGRASLTIAGIDDLIPRSSRDLLAPFGNEIRIARGLGDEVVRLGVFRIDRATVSGGVDGPMVTIDGNDRSGRFTDEPFDADGFIGVGTNAADAILSVLQPIWPALPYQFAAVAAALPKVVWSEGDDRWAFAQGIAAAIGGELYFNDDGMCVLRPIPNPVAGSPVAATFSEGEGGVLLGINRDWDRSDVYNRWVVTGENTTNADVVRGVAVDDNPTSPTFYGPGFGKKTGRWSSSFISTDAQAADAAAGKLARSTGAPDNISLEAIVDPARRPSEVVRITRAELGIDEEHVLDQVSIPLAADGRMTAQTRATRVV